MSGRIAMAGTWRVFGQVGGKADANNPMRGSEFRGKKRFQGFSLRVRDTPAECLLILRVLEELL